MSILIKDMEMPKSCMACDLFVNDEYCPVLKYKPRNDQILTASCCPLEEVSTPHGRLVDINTILHDGNRVCLDELINDPELSEQIKVGVSAARVIICSAPTIIEAEE